MHNDQRRLLAVLQMFAHSWSSLLWGDAIMTPPFAKETKNKYKIKMKMKNEEEK